MLSRPTRLRRRHAPRQAAKAWHPTSDTPSRFLPRLYQPRLRSRRWCETDAAAVGYIMRRNYGVPVSQPKSVLQRSPAMLSARSSRRAAALLAAADRLGLPGRPRTGRRPRRPRHVAETRPRRRGLLLHHAPQQGAAGRSSPTAAPGPSSGRCRPCSKPGRSSRTSTTPPRQPVHAAPAHARPRKTRTSSPSSATPSPTRCSATATTAGPTSSTSTRKPTRACSTSPSSPSSITSPATAPRRKTPLRPILSALAKNPDINQGP